MGIGDDAAQRLDPNDTKAVSRRSGSDALPVPVGNSGSAILVVQAAQNRNGKDVTVRLHSARVRRVLAQG